MARTSKEIPVEAPQEMQEQDVHEMKEQVVQEQDIQEQVVQENDETMQTISQETELHDLQPVVTKLKHLVNIMINDFSADFANDFENEAYVPTDEQLEAVAAKIEEFKQSYNDEVAKNTELIKENESVQKELSELTKEFNDFKASYVTLEIENKKLAEENKQIQVYKNMNFWQRLYFLFTGKPCK